MAELVRNIFGSRQREPTNEDPNSTTTTILEDGDDKISEGPFMASAAFYIAVILLIGVPMWFYTCSVTRYSTPSLRDLESKLFELPALSVHLDISIVQLSLASQDSTLTAAANGGDAEQDSVTRYLRSHLPKALKTSIENVSYNIDWRVRRPTYQESTIFKTHLTRDATTDSPKEDSLADLETKLLDVHKSSSKFRLFMYLIREQDHPAFCQKSRVHSYTINVERFVYLCPSSAISKPDDHSSIVALVIEALEEIYVNTVDESKAKLILDSRVDLLFTLVPEAMNSEGFKQLVGLADKIHHIFERNLRQKHLELKSLINIKPITQNYLDLLENNLLGKLLGTKPQEAQRSAGNQTTGTARQEPLREILVDKVPQLFRSFESRLSMHSAKNVHNVLLLVPQIESPRIMLKTARPNGKLSASNLLNYLEGEDNRSLLIVNDEKSLVLGLRAIVRKLAGLSSPNICKSCLVRRDTFFCSWELDAIMGTLTIMKLHSTYLSLKAIDQQVMGIKIPKDVAQYMRDSHDFALGSIENLRNQRTYEAHNLANRAYELGEAAFYNPALIESLYFPDDLKYAIYLPFFLPLAYPMILSIVKLLRYTIRGLLCRNQKVKTE